VAGNVFCKDDPGEMVMGFFSVSSVSSRRLFIEDSFAGKYERYSKCATDSVYGTGPITGLNRSVWVLYDYPFFIPPLRIVTDIKECADCTVRGSRTKPPFWEDDKK
jgi:hypothetical protein